MTVVPGMTMFPTILVVVLAIAAVRNGRLAIDLTAPIKSIDEVAQGNIKVYTIKYLCRLFLCDNKYFYKLVAQGGAEVRQEAHQKI